jgi:hypothetical protein
MERGSCARALHTITRHQPRFLLILALMPILLTPRLASARGIIGNQTFLSPIVGNDAFPDNALTLTGRGSDYEFSLLPELEKQLSVRLLPAAGFDRPLPARTASCPC